MLTDAAAKISHLHMLGVNCVGIESRSVIKDRREARVVRARQFQDVATNRQASDSDDATASRRSVTLSRFLD
jgi:hypothetical protein